MSVMNIATARKRTIRAPINPMDRSTIVSIYPRKLEEKKHTIQPGIFRIPAGSVESPSILVVGPSSWWREIDEEQPLLEIPTSSIAIANSIVNDFCNGLLGCNMADSMPGLFWVPGEYEVKDVKTHPKVKPLYEQAVAKQKNYYLALIKLADGLWARTNGNPLIVSDDMRMAARELGQTGKEWMKDFIQQAQMDKCPACGSFVNLAYPICSNCKTVINAKKYAEMGLVQAKETK